MENSKKRLLEATWELVVGRLTVAENASATVKEKDFFTLVEEARQEWQSAMTYFNQIVEPELVDHAIHAMVAAEKKYMYLLKKARREEYCLPVNLDSLRGGRGGHGH